MWPKSSFLFSSCQVLFSQKVPLHRKKLSFLQTDEMVAHSPLLVMRPYKSAFKTQRLWKWTVGSLKEHVSVGKVLFKVLIYHSSHAASVLIHHGQALFLVPIAGQYLSRVLPWKGKVDAILSVIHLSSACWPTSLEF